MSNSTFTVILVLAALIVLAVLASSPIIAYTTVEEFDGQVVRYPNEKNQNAMIVLKNSETGQNETFENEDSFWQWKWNSRDYLALDLNREYHFKVNGLRVPFPFSWSRNLISASPVQ